MATKSTKSTDIPEFKKKLLALLDEYPNISIDFELDGDTHGVYNEHFVIYDCKTREEVNITSKGVYSLDNGDFIS